MPIELATFLQPAVQPVFDKLFSMGEKLLLSKLTGAEVADTVKRWKVQLKIFGPLLIDAEQKKSSNETVKSWLRDLQDVAYDMEDMLDHFAIQDHEKELETASDEDIGIIDTITNMFSSFLLNPINPIDPGVQSQIDDINKRLESLQSQIQYLSLSVTDYKPQQTISIQTEALRKQRESTSIESEQEIFGRDSKKQEIMALLLKDDDQSNKKNYAVIPIVGKGGVGKTTLAQYVYNDEQLKDRFDLKAWVCVSDVFDVKRITTSIFNKAATGQNVSNFSDLNEAQEKLEEQLKGKRFLIVLDDIWNDNYDEWVKLRAPFRNAAKGSRVIITTRIEKIARMMLDESINTTIINLEGLQDDECWCLFQQHICVDSDLSEMRGNIIKKCKGLPLAVKALGGLLRKTHDKGDRKRIILQSETWSEENNVLSVLKLSYDYLPSHLKRVFAYCSLFPEDYVFTEMQVVLLWMAQGFLPENQTQRMEDIGHNYFCELVSRSLFEASPSSEKGFIMHDLIHDLALWAADDICYVRSTANTPHRALNRIRHVFLTEDATKLGNQLPMASQWRTFYCPSNNESIEDLDLIPRFRYMRSLYLTSKKINVLPECIGDLKHLRFLVLEFDKVEELPKSINSLWNLQSLGLDCYRLQHVPNIGFLGKLRHLYIDTTSLREMPIGIGELKNLQNLNEFFLGDGCGERIRDLKNLNHLHGKLKISGLKSVVNVEDAKEVELDKKYGLDELCLKWSRRKDAANDISREDVLEQLKPHNLIKRLILSWYSGKRFPTWLGNPCFSKMVEIRLKKCEKCAYLPPLGQLPSLKNIFIFRMEGIKEIGAEFYGDLRCQNPSFPVLESLKFKNMESWEKWVHSPSHDRAFLHLKELSIEDCPSLEGELPPHLPSLTKLIIQDCGELISFSLQSVPLLEVLESRRCNVIFNDGDGWCFDVEAQCVNTPCELPHLTTLKIEKCKSPKSLPEGLLLPALQYLAFWDCENMECLPSQLHKYTSLKTLTIFKCPKIQEIPEGGLPINLEELRIEDVRVQELAMHQLHSLRSLNLKTVGMTQEDLSLPSSLSELTILGSQNLKTISSCTTLPNLTTLRVQKISECTSIAGYEGNITKFQCNKCNKSYTVQNVIPRYKFQIRVIDDSGSASLFVMFDREVVAIMHKSACELRESLGQHNSHDSYPEELNNLVGRRFLFKVEVSDYNLKQNRPINTVGRISDNEELIATFLRTYVGKDMVSDSVSNEIYILDQTSNNTKNATSFVGENDQTSELSPISSSKTLTCEVESNELCLTWRCLRTEETDDISKEDVLEQLKPHSLIKQLELDEYMGLRFPTWLGNPCFSKMVSIRLVNCKKCEDLPPLGQLPSLKNIFIFGIGGIKEVGAEFHGDLMCQNPSFPVLESLKFKNVESWEKWVDSPSPPYKRAFLRLKELSIKDCPSLEGELPPHLPSLTKLIIKDCPSLEGELPPHLPSLTKLKIKYCKELSFSLQSVPLLEVLESERCNFKVFPLVKGWEDC